MEWKTYYSNWVLMFSKKISLLFLCVFTLVACLSTRENTPIGTSKIYKTQKGLLLIYEDRISGGSNRGIVQFYPLKDSTYSLTLESFTIAEYDTGYSVLGMSGILRLHLIDNYGEKKITRADDMLGLPIELTYMIYAHRISDKFQVESERSGSKMKQKELYLNQTVTFIDYDTIDDIP